MLKIANDYELAILVWLCSIKNFNGALGLKLLEYFGNITDFYNAPEDELRELLPPGALKAFYKNKPQSPEEILSQLKQSNINFVSLFDGDYPVKLSEIPDAPLGLFYKGRLPDQTLPSVAIIGARECSEYGSYVATELGSYLGKAGVQVISGMARGIDGISQNATINAGGSSYAVLGSGVNVCYPPTNRALYNKLSESGGIISTYGINEPAISGNFPPRNRIVSGLSDAIVVIEARQRSGTLITVDMALEQGREVYAVPGRITDRLSDGCNGLIGQGASVYLSPDILLAELMEVINGRSSKRRAGGNAVNRHRNFEGSRPIPPEISDEQLPVYKVLDITPQNIDAICSKLPDDYDYSLVSLILMQLVLSGHVNQLSQGCFARNS